MEIGFFQLENLFLTNTRFCFLDLRRNPPPQLHPALDGILERAHKISVKGLDSYLTETNVSKTAPIILLCEDGKISGSLAPRLEGQGYLNVYVVDGGTAGLLSEV